MLNYMYLISWSLEKTFPGGWLDQLGKRKEKIRKRIVKIMVHYCYASQPPAAHHTKKWKFGHFCMVT